MKYKFFVFFLIFCLIPFTAFAEDESTSESTTSATVLCNHNFELTGFNCDTGLATFTCSLCSQSYTDYFADHVSGDLSNNNNYEPLFDVVPDGVINIRDYAYLVRSFSTDFSLNEFTDKEKFILIYSTCLSAVGVFCICIFRRKAS